MKISKFFPRDATIASQIFLSAPVVGKQRQLMPLGRDGKMGKTCGLWVLATRKELFLDFFKKNEK